MNEQPTERLEGRRIESTANPYVKDVARLKDRRGRQRSGRFLVEGARETERALAGGVGALELLLAPDLHLDVAQARSIREAALAALGPMDEVWSGDVEVARGEDTA